MDQQPRTPPDLQLWGAYLIGYQHGVRAMHTAIPVEPPEFNVGQLRYELERQERAA